jgi:hypothetical protein
LLARRRLLKGAAACIGLPTLVACNAGNSAAPGELPAPTGSGKSRRYRLDFADAPLEIELSAGGAWSNNTQGVGGNGAPSNMTSMCVGLASDGKTRIAMATHGGIRYDDSFAFVPGFGEDQFIEAVVYKEAGYNPNAHGANHEVELLLGCSSSPGFHEWNECLFNAGGGTDIAHIKGGPDDFHVIGNMSGRNRLNARHGDVLRADKVGKVISLYLNGILMHRYNGFDPKRLASGSGIGIGGFIRPGAVHNKYGFISVQMGTL